MVDDGVHPRVIQYRLGHATARLSQEMYAKVSDAADEEAAAPAGGTVFVCFGHAAGTKARQRLMEGFLVEAEMALELVVCEWR